MIPNALSSRPVPGSLGLAVTHSLNALFLAVQYPVSIVHIKSSFVAVVVLLSLTQHFLPSSPSFIHCPVSVQFIALLSSFDPS